MHSWVDLKKMDLIINKSSKTQYQQQNLNFYFQFWSIIYDFQHSCIYCSTREKMHFIFITNHFEDIRTLGWYPINSREILALKQSIFYQSISDEYHGKFKRK